MHDAEEYVYTEHVHSGYGEPAELLPCSVVNHTLYMDFMPPGFHYTLCEDCTLVTGFDIYLCMRSCTICGMHVHLQETEHDCPLRGTLVF